MADPLEHLAEHDLLTGVYNRTRLVDELDRQLSYSARYSRPSALLTLDIDNFKLSNDTYGRAAGDIMLKSVSEILRTRARSTDVIARLGSDEFALILPEASEDEAMIVSRDIRAALSERQLGPPILVSIGIALLTGDEEVGADDILSRAQIALYEAKEHGGDRAYVYTAEASGALTWVQRIRAALAEDRFVLYGQPIADLRTGRITHHELLVRMLSEDGDIIPPAAFLPMAERFGVIGEIDRWVTSAGLRLAIEGEGVAVNLSGYSIGDPSIVAEIRSAIADGVDPGKVIFDVNETAAMSKLEATRQFAGLLYGMGCSLALDDFGTGFSSFTFLKYIPARYLKIDMGFIRELASSKLDHQVVKSIVGIARCLDKRTIAEGVQDAETLGVLKAIGADYAQGFHFGAPKRLSPPTAFERQLRAARAAAVPTVWAPAPSACARPRRGP
jgi:diguanylate cyclase (GGDEF)-like protein